MCLIHRGVDEAEAVPAVNANIVANAATAVKTRRALAMPMLLSLHVGHRLGEQDSRHGLGRGSNRVCLHWSLEPVRPQAATAGGRPSDEMERPSVPSETTTAARRVNAARERVIS